MVVVSRFLSGLFDEQVAESFDGSRNQLRKFHDPWHRLTLRDRCAPSKIMGMNHKNTYHCKVA